MGVSEAKQWWDECGSITSLSFEEVVTLTEMVDNLFAEVERLTDQLAELKVAASPFVRATRLQEILNLPDDNKPVREWMLGAWPTMRDARRLVSAEKAVQLGADVLFCPVCFDRLPKGRKVCCGVWHTDSAPSLPPRR